MSATPASAQAEPVVDPEQLRRATLASSVGSALEYYDFYIFGLATALIFDVGVYLAVVGLSLEILRSLGGEIDRHGELEGLQGPDDLVIIPHEDDRAALKHEMDAEAMMRMDEDSSALDKAQRRLASPPRESTLSEWER